MYEAEDRKARSQRATGGQHRIRIHVTLFCPCIHPWPGASRINACFFAAKGGNKRIINSWVLEAADSGLD